MKKPIPPRGAFKVMPLWQENLIMTALVLVVLGNIVVLALAVYSLLR